jgi:hypothetical protein
LLVESVAADAVKTTVESAVSSIATFGGLTAASQVSAATNAASEAQHQVAVSESAALKSLRGKPTTNHGASASKASRNGG